MIYGKLFNHLKIETFYSGSSFPFPVFYNSTYENEMVSEWLFFEIQEFI